MQIVIDIPENVIEDAKTSPNYYPTYHFEKIWKAIINGTPLPKGHGRLIDVDSIISITLEDSLNIMTHLKGDDVDCKIEAPTIIKADKAESEEV